MSDTALDALIQAKVVEEATMHGGRYLLPHRLRDVDNPEWRACERLVEQRLARWLPWTSSYAPGIELEFRTNKGAILSVSRSVRNV